MSDEAISLEDRYRIGARRALISGCQALVRLPIMQRALDRRLGLRTAGYISGYRGSPLGGYDDALWKAASHLAENGIVFHPGLNEDLALTAVAGTQQIDFVPGKKVDGVFALWYGKGPGVDRSGDAIKHANLQGVSPKGGVVPIYGDDHAGKSSTTAHQSELTLASWGVPTLYPSSVTEILELGLAAVAMSRHSGLLVGLKLVNETAEATAVVDLPLLPDFVIPDAPEVEGGVHIRPEVMAMQRQDARLVRHKLPMAALFSRANRLDRIVFGHDQPAFLVATAGKAYPDVMAALDLLAIDEIIARRVGIGVYKIALIYPLEAAGLGEAAARAVEICFVEEKRAHAETQALSVFYHLEPRPRVTGKRAPDGTPLLPADMPLDPATVALALAERLEASIPGLAEQASGFADAAARLRGRRPASPIPIAARRPAFCPGCPHNLSTKVPEDSVGATGIGCHSMVLFHPERNPIPMGQMGAEGANWIGLSNFVETPHVFQNLGDGTYNHSGSLAIRAAVQAGTAVTFKILFNDAVAMTGGQPVEGGLTVARVVEQVRSEGVGRIVVLSEDPSRFAREPLPSGMELRHRDDLSIVQKALRKEPGVTVIVYDQVCAAEKRRRRKSGAFPDPDRRTFINALVCEGCGDCSVSSNCLAIQPLETELGRKRRIDQSACNKDFSCIAGFCPSFVTIEGGKPRKIAPQMKGRPDAASPGEPVFRVPADEFDMLVAGIGGTGVVTVGAVLGMAAQIDGLHASLFDMTGLSQKGGAVFSHVRIRRDSAAIVSARIGPAEADLVLGCDLVAAVHPDVLAMIADRTLVVGNADTAATAGFQLNRDAAVDHATLVAALAAAAGTAPSMLHASELATRTFGDSIAANMILLGHAWQLGGIPLSRDAIVKAIELNNRSVAANLAAFETGRQAALAPPPAEERPESIDLFIERRTEDLARYWNSRYATRFAELMNEVRAAAEGVEGSADFVWAAARSAFKLMAYKDEYEVARLYTDGRFRAAVAREFEDARSLRIHLSPPMLARTDPRTGHPRKIAFGPWIFPLLSLLAALRPLRETVFDPFGRTAERRLERELRDAFLAVLKRLCASLSDATLSEAMRIARAPLAVRGFGHVKTPAARELLRELKALPAG